MTEFTEISNPWSEYQLPDGRKMRIRHILTDVTPVGTDQDGLARYNVTLLPVIVIEPTAEQIAKATEQQERIQLIDPDEGVRYDLDESQDHLFPTKRTDLQ